MKPWKHAESSAKIFGGKPEDYIEIHNEMDSSKSAFADVRHRAIFHSAFGIYIIERMFGETIVVDGGIIVSVRDIAEQHILEDLGRIPSMQDWLEHMAVQDWMLSEKRRKKNKPSEPEKLTKTIKEIVDQLEDDLPPAKPKTRPLTPRDPFVVPYQPQQPYPYIVPWRDPTYDDWTAPNTAPNRPDWNRLRVVD